MEIQNNVGKDVLGQQFQILVLMRKYLDYDVTASKYSVAVLYY
jgi:hypothetical protein